MYSSSSLASSCGGCCCCSYSVRPNVTDSLRSCLSLYGWIVTSRVKLVSGDKINKWRMCGGEFYEYLFWLSLPPVRLSFFSSFCLSLSFTSSTSVTFSFFLPLLFVWTSICRIFFLYLVTVQFCALILPLFSLFVILSFIFAVSFLSFSFCFITTWLPSPPILINVIIPHSGTPSQVSTRLSLSLRSWPEVSVWDRSPSWGTPGTGSTSASLSWRESNTHTHTHTHSII